MVINSANGASSKDVLKIAEKVVSKGVYINGVSTDYIITIVCNNALYTLKYYSRESVDAKNPLFVRLTFRVGRENSKKEIVLHVFSDFGISGIVNSGFSKHPHRKGFFVTENSNITDDHNQEFWQTEMDNAVTALLVCEW